jgi:hypothetical protein
LLFFDKAFKAVKKQKEVVFLAPKPKSRGLIYQPHGQVQWCAALGCGKGLASIGFRLLNKC